MENKDIATFFFNSITFVVLKWFIDEGMFIAKYVA